MTAVPAVPAPTTGEAISLQNQIVVALLDHQQKVRAQIRHWLMLGTLVLGLGVGYVAWTAHQIRDTQTQNVTKQVEADKNQRNASACQLRAMNALLRDVPLAFSGDRNPKDYAPVVKHCS
jgi:hypothetical protein